MNINQIFVVHISILFIGIIIFMLLIKTRTLK